MNGLDLGRYVFAAPYWGWLCRGSVMTLLIGVLSAALGTLLGLLVLRCRLAGGILPRMTGAIYVHIFRNLPVVPLLLFLTFALPDLWRQITGWHLPRDYEFAFLLLGLALNAGAYIAEILRAGMTAVPGEQLEAARVLGLAPAAIYRRVIFPQALGVVAPALASRYIHIVKNSSLALVAPLAPDLMEMLGQAERIAGQTFSWAEPLIFAALGYLTLALALSRLSDRLLSRLAGQMSRCQAGRSGVRARGWGEL